MLTWWRSFECIGPSKGHDRGEKPRMAVRFLWSLAFVGKDDIVYTEYLLDVFAEQHVR